MDTQENNSDSSKKHINWRSVLPPTGAGAAIILLLIAMAVSCHRLYYNGMVHVEAGQFEMGCEEGLEREKPEHTVILDGFWIDQYEVINSQYVEFLNQGYEEGWIDTVEYLRTDGSSWFQAEKDDNRVIYLYPSIPKAQIYFEDGLFHVLEGKELIPVAVSWYGAAAYCESFDKRLPTEAEWEYAAKGGHLSHYEPGVTNYYRYSGSNDADEVAWHYSNSSAAQPGGELAPNELDIYDMSGNMREWVNDWYDPYYPSTTVENPQGPESPVINPETDWYSGKTMRGGAWWESYDDMEIEMDIDRALVRVTKRNWGCPSSVSDRSGFRCVAPERNIPTPRFTKPFSIILEPERYFMPAEFMEQEKLEGGQYMTQPEEEEAPS